jgi:hypothetical protein
MIAQKDFARQYLKEAGKYQSEVWKPSKGR